MQFHLETDELNLLANVLLERVSAISAQASSPSRIKSDSDPDFQQYNELLDKVLVHDLRFDCGELEQTADLLASKKRSLKDEIAREPNTTLKMELQRKLALLERVLERVNEVCVMF